MGAPMKPAPCATCAPVKAAPCTSCTQGAPCAQPKPACTSCGWGRLSRLAAFFCYHDHGNCPADCHSCQSGCHAPLYLLYLRDCAYQNGSNCQCNNGTAQGAVNPPYARSVFPPGTVAPGGFTPCGAGCGGYGGGCGCK
jgi:hypothetical protein